MTGENIGNRREALGWLAGGGIFATALLAVNQTRGDDNPVDLAKVPKVVKDAANRVEPGTTWIWAGKVDDDGKTAYELDGKDEKKREVTVLVTAKGKVIEVETELKKPTNVPDKVLNAVKARWPRFEPTETHELRQGEDLKGPKDGDYVYDMRGTIAKDRYIQVQVQADGKITESTVEVPLEKVPDVVTVALKEKRPRFEIGTAYLIREDGDLIGYHFEGKGPKGRDLTIAVTPKGEKVEVIE